MRERFLSESFFALIFIIMMNGRPAWAQNESIPVSETENADRPSGKLAKHLKPLQDRYAAYRASESERPPLEADRKLQ